MVWGLHTELIIEVFNFKASSTVDFNVGSNLFELLSIMLKNSFSDKFLTEDIKLYFCKVESSCSADKYEEGCRDDFIFFDEYLVAIR